MKILKKLFCQFSHFDWDKVNVVMYFSVEKTCLRIPNYFECHIWMFGIFKSSIYVCWLCVVFGEIVKIFENEIEFWAVEKWITIGNLWRFHIVTFTLTSYLPYPIQYPSNTNIMHIGIYAIQSQIQIEINFSILFMS